MRRKRLISELNVVPYIDVMLVLLVIFMVTAPLMTQGLNIELPRTSADALSQTDDEPLVVSLNGGGELFFSVNADPKQAITLLEIIDKLQKILQSRPNAQVLIEADGQLAYEQVIDLMAQLQAAGVTSVGLVTEPVET